MEATDARLPSAKGRSGRHYERQHLSGIVLKYRHRLAAEFVSLCCARAGVALDRHGTAYCLPYCNPGLQTRAKRRRANRAYAKRLSQSSLLCVGTVT
jgi:hypothetical protein